MIRRRGMGLLIPRDVRGVIRDAAGQPTPSASPAADSRVTASISNRGREAELFFKNQAGRSLANPTAPVYQQAAPWIDPPPGFEEFYTPGIIATPNVGTGDTTALTITVPAGWDGVIKRVANWYSGVFSNGSGDIIWRLLRNGQPFKNFDALLISLGSPASPFDFGRGGLLVQSGDVITGIVSNVAGIAPGTQSAWFIGGYLYPRQQ